MLRFNRKLMASIGEASQRARLLGFLRAKLPQLQSLPAAELEQAVDELLHECKRHGLRSQHASALYVLANLAMGREAVARDPAVGEILEARSRPLADRALLLEIWLTQAWGQSQAGVRA